MLDAHGWGDLQPVLNRMTKEGKWDQPAGEVSDEMLTTFAAVGTPTEAATIARKRFAGIIDSVVLGAGHGPEVLAEQRRILAGD